MKNVLTLLSERCLIDAYGDVVGCMAGEGHLDCPKKHDRYELTLECFKESTKGSE